MHLIIFTSSQIGENLVIEKIIKNILKNSDDNILNFFPLLISSLCQEYKDHRTLELSNCINLSGNHEKQGKFG